MMKKVKLLALGLVLAAALLAPPVTSADPDWMMCDVDEFVYTACWKVVVYHSGGTVTETWQCMNFCLPDGTGGNG